MLYSSELVELLEALQIISGRHASLFDTRDHIVYSSGTPCRFCKLIQSDEVGHNSCLQSDLNALMEANRLGKPVAYRCHAGLCELVVPIKDNDILVGRLMIGQYLDDSPLEDQWELIKERCAGRQDLGRLRQCFDELPQVNDATMRAYIKILTTFSMYIHLKNLMGAKKSDLASTLEEYIDLHLGEKLSLQRISRDLCVCKTNLCRVAKEEFDSTILNIIKSKRLKKAVYLLENSDLPISQIAEQIGYPDSNYFSRLFSDAIGISPMSYRKKYQEKTNLHNVRPLDLLE